MLKYYLTSSNHHNTVEFLNTVEFQFVLQSCFYVLPRNANIMTDKGFNLFDECAARCVNLFPQEEVHLSFLREQ